MAARAAEREARVSGKKAYRETPRVRRKIPKHEPGTHNRAARRAAKAQQEQLFTEPTLEQDIWRLLVEHQKRERARREATPTPFDAQQYEFEHGYHNPWPEHIPMQQCITSALRAAPRYSKLSPRDFTRAGARIADYIAFDGAEHLACDTGKLSKRELLDKRRQVAALGRALALGSCAPGGIKFCGVWLETVDGETALRVLVPKESSQCA